MFSLSYRFVIRKKYIDSAEHNKILGKTIKMHLYRVTLWLNIHLILKKTTIQNQKPSRNFDGQDYCWNELFPFNNTDTFSKAFERLSTEIKNKFGVLFWLQEWILVLFWPAISGADYHGGQASADWGTNKREGWPPAAG